MFTGDKLVDSKIANSFRAIYAWVLYRTKGQDTPDLHDPLAPGMKRCGAPPDKVAARSLAGSKKNRPAPITAAFFDLAFQ